MCTNRSIRSQLRKIRGKKSLNLVANRATEALFIGICKKH